MKSIKAACLALFVTACSSTDTTTDAAPSIPDAAPDATPDARLVDCADPTVTALLGDWSLTLTTEARCTTDMVLSRFYWITCDGGATSLTINSDWPTDRAHVDRSITALPDDHVMIDVVVHDNLDPTIFEYGEQVTMHQVVSQGGVPVLEGTGRLVVGVGDMACQEGITVEAIHDPLPAPP